MKLKYTLTASVLALGLTAGIRAEDAKTPAASAPSATAPATAPAAAAPQFSEAQLLQTLGWIVGKRIGLSELGFNNEQTQEIVKGLVLASNGKEAPYDLQKIGPEMDKFMQEKQQQYMSKVRQQGQAETQKFFADLKGKQGVTVLPSGVAYEILKPGSGEYPKATDTVKVNYVGTLINGNKFDSSSEPVEFPLNGVIPGWTEGIQKINKGGKIKLYIPPQLAYGDQAQPGIPPGSTLIFEVELIDVKPTQAPAAAAQPAGSQPAAPAPATK